MNGQAWLIGLVVLMALAIIYLICRQYMLSHALSDAVMVLVQQVWALREAVLMQTHPHAPPMVWEHDALSVQGRRGDLLVRRHRLQREWARQFRGERTGRLHRIEQLIGRLDEELRAYGLSLAPISAMTLRMMENAYRGAYHESANLTKHIVRYLRLI